MARITVTLDVRDTWPTTEEEILETMRGKIHPAFALMELLVKEGKKGVYTITILSPPSTSYLEVEDTVRRIVNAYGHWRVTSEIDWKAW